VRARQPVNFQRVAAAAGVSPAWLYKHADVKARIAALRDQGTPLSWLFIHPDGFGWIKSQDMVARPVASEGGRGFAHRLTRARTVSTQRRANRRRRVRPWASMYISKAER